MLYLSKSKLQTVAQTPENNVLIQFTKHCFYIFWKNSINFPIHAFLKTYNPFYTLMQCIHMSVLKIVYSYLIHMHANKHMYKQTQIAYNKDYGLRYRLIVHVSNFLAEQIFDTFWNQG
jgi:hypothetical protein